MNKCLPINPGTERKNCVGSSLFGGRIKKCTRNLSCLISPPSAIDCSLGLHETTRLITNYRWGERGYLSSAGESGCVCLFMSEVWWVSIYSCFFFVRLLPPFIALQRHRLSVCVLGGFALYLCVWSVWLTGVKGFCFFKGGRSLLEHTIHPKNSLFGSSSLSLSSLPLSLTSPLLVSVNISSVWLYLPDLDGELFQAQTEEL